jgi:hypothetical protein
MGAQEKRKESAFSWQITPPAPRRQGDQQTGLGMTG